MQRFRAEVLRGWVEGRREETLDLRAEIVAEGTGHLPTEFWSSLESSVG